MKNCQKDGHNYYNDKSGDHVDKDISHLIEDFIGVIVNIEVTVQVAVFAKLHYQTWYTAYLAITEL